MKRASRLLASGLFAAVLSLRCGGGGGPAPATYTVTYDGNGNTGGTAPVDSKAYPTGHLVTVLGNIDALVKTGDTFAGWNTLSNGTGTAYAPGQTFPMGASNVTLYAVWTVAPNIVFVTSTAYAPGALGGLAGADSDCQARATAANLPGTYKAWLSTSGTDEVDAIARLGAASGWVRPDGKPFVDTIADLASGNILYPPRLDEFGNDLGQAMVVTATASDGSLSTTSVTCGNYTDTTDTGNILGGLSSAGSWLFTDYEAFPCATLAHLYCFQVDQVAAVSPTPVSGRRAFVTNGVFSSGGGPAVADALCASEASAAGLSGTFLAALATTTASARSRFDTTGAPWVRADGLALAPTAAALFTGEYTDVSLDMNADGTRRYDLWEVWSGAPGWDEVGTAAGTCSDYTSTAESSTAVIGLIGDTALTTLLDLGTDYCSTGTRLICLQE
ncbi:MAG TPA: InlB B-repeat-containing protein [Anaeromyxobacter sp.]|nr:InlB B-repeat-containing protein [Anaeromyxobacter sp.]